MRDYCENCGTEYGSGMFCAGCGTEIVVEQPLVSRERIRRPTNEQHWRSNQERVRQPMNEENLYGNQERARYSTYGQGLQINIVDGLKNMHPQRMTLLIASAVGILSLLLPWASGPILGSFSGLAGGGAIYEYMAGLRDAVIFNGTFVLVVFALLAGISLLGKWTSPIMVIMKILVVILAIINAFKVLFFWAHIHDMDELSSAILGRRFSLGLGFYLAIVVIICTLVAPFLIRRKSC